MIKRLQNSAQALVLSLLVTTTGSALACGGGGGGAYRKPPRPDQTHQHAVNRQASIKQALTDETVPSSSTIPCGNCLER